MKKLKVLGAISFALIGGGALVSISLAITSCGEKTTHYNIFGTNWKGYVSGSLTLTLNGTNNTAMVEEQTDYVANNLVIPGYVWNGAKEYALTSIGNYAFYGCGLSGSLTIGNSVAAIGEDAFYDCSSITNLTLPNSLTGIGVRAFFGCSNITKLALTQVNANPDFKLIDGTTGNIVIDGSLQTNAFLIKSTNIPDAGNVTINPTTGSFGGIATKTLTIPAVINGKTVTSIGDNAFSYCYNITNLTLSNSLTSIGTLAFDRCTSLTSLALPNSLTTIGNYAFYGCSSIAFFDFSSLFNKSFTFGSDWCHGCTNVHYMVFPSTFTLTNTADNGWNEVGSTSFDDLYIKGVDADASINISGLLTWVNSHDRVKNWEYQQIV